MVARPAVTIGGLEDNALSRESSNTVSLALALLFRLLLFGGLECIGSSTVSSSTVSLAVGLGFLPLFFGGLECVDSSTASSAVSPVTAFGFRPLLALVLLVGVAIEMAMYPQTRIG